VNSPSVIRFVERYPLLAGMLLQLPQLVLPLMFTFLASLTRHSMFETAAWSSAALLALVGPLAASLTLTVLRCRRGLTTWPVLLLNLAITLQLLAQIIVLAAVGDAVLPSFDYDDKPDVMFQRICMLDTCLNPLWLLCSGLFLLASGLAGYLFGRWIGRYMVRHGKWPVANAPLSRNRA
jgi:hypothetical protein